MGINAPPISTPKSTATATEEIPKIFLSPRYSQSSILDAYWLRCLEIQHSSSFFKAPESDSTVAMPRNYMGVSDFVKLGEKIDKSVCGEMLWEITDEETWERWLPMRVQGGKIIIEFRGIS